MVLTVGFCLFSSDFPCDLEQNIRDLNKIVISAGNGKFSEQIQLQKGFVDFIQFYTEIKELSTIF